MSLILSPSLVLTAPAQFDRRLPIIGWDNQITVAGTAAHSEEINFPATNVANPSTNLFWRSETTDEQYLTFALNEERSSDYIGIARHNLGSAGIVVSVEVQNFAGGDWAELVAGFVVPDDAPILIRFLELAASAMRLKFVPLATPPEIAVVYVGNLLVVPMDIPAGHTPLIDGRVTRTTSGNSEAGDFLGSIVLSQKLASSVSFQYLDDDWYRVNMRPFVRQGRGTPFFFSGFPETQPREAGYAWLTSDPRPDFIGNEWVNISLNMGGIIA